MSSNRVTSIYETKDGTKIKLLHDNEKTADGNISMTTKAYLFVDGGVKQIADLESSRPNNLIPEAGATIDRIQVEPEYKRQGIATAMLNFARSYSQDNIKIDHSFSLTDDAKGWSSVVKHGDHDQSTHGSWAAGNFDEEKEYDGAVGTYSERYGVDSDGNRVGVSVEEHDAIDDYSQNGYKRINEYLRGRQNEKTELDPAEAKSIIENDESLYLRAIDEYSENNEVGAELTESELEDAIYTYATKHGAELLERVNSGETPMAERNQRDIDALDKLIDESPALFGEKTLYRVFSDKVLENLQEGDIMRDPGFLSTTRIDVTQEGQSSARTWMGGIKETPDTVGVILPSESWTGKGLAVDIYRTVVDDTSTVADTEKEILLPRDTPLKFIGYKTDVGTEARVAVFQRMDK
jgi:GNAT superfamily N-acetyltransferase